MEAPESRAEPEAQLFSCPVRRRYAWQVVRYGRGVRAARRELLAADRGEPTAGTRALESLRALLVAAQTETGYYPEAFARAGVTARDLREPGDLAHFPPLPRAALQERFHDLFSRRVRPFEVDEGWLGRSSGSTGEPVPFFMDGGSIHFFSAFLRFLWERFSLGPFPGPRGTAVVLLCTLPRSSVYSARLPLLGGGIFRKLHFAEEGALGTLERLGPTIVTGDPDSLGRLLTELAAGRVRLAPRLVVSSAFALPAGTAAGLAAATGARVVDSYSLAETGPVGWSCAPGSGRFHLLTPAAVLEEVEGELLLTNLRNTLFPLVRYRTGDLGVVLPEPARRRAVRLRRARPRPGAAPRAGGLALRDGGRPPRRPVAAAAARDAARRPAVPAPSARGGTHRPPLHARGGCVRSGAPRGDAARAGGGRATAPRRRDVRLVRAGTGAPLPARREADRLPVGRPADAGCGRDGGGSASRLFLKEPDQLGVHPVEGVDLDPVARVGDPHDPQVPDEGLETVEELGVRATGRARPRGRGSGRRSRPPRGRGAPCRS